MNEQKYIQSIVDRSNDNTALFTEAEVRALLDVMVRQQKALDASAKMRQDLKELSVLAESLNRKLAEMKGR